jgi:hypothetical protein
MKDPFLQLREYPYLGKRHLLQTQLVSLDAPVHVVVVVSTFRKTRTEVLKFVIDEFSLLQRSDVFFKVRFRPKPITFAHEPNERFSNSLTLRDTSIKVAVTE